MSNNSNDNIQLSSAVVSSDNTNSPSHNVDPPAVRLHRSRTLPHLLPRSGVIPHHSLSVPPPLSTGSGSRQFPPVDQQATPTPAPNQQPPPPPLVPAVQVVRLHNRLSNPGYTLAAHGATFVVARAIYFFYGGNVQLESARIASGAPAPPPTPTVDFFRNYGTQVSAGAYLFTFLVYWLIPAHAYYARLVTDDASVIFGYLYLVALSISYAGSGVETTILGLVLLVLTFGRVVRVIDTENNFVALPVQLALPAPVAPPPPNDGGTPPPPPPAPKTPPPPPSQ